MREETKEGESEMKKKEGLPLDWRNGSMKTCQTIQSVKSDAST